MTHEAGAIRFILIALSALVFVFMILKTLRVIRKMTFGQVLYMAGSYCMLAYAADAAREAFLLDVGWRFRLVFYIAGIALYCAYVLMPERKHNQMFKGKSWFTKEPKGEHEKIREDIRRYGPGGHVWSPPSSEKRPVPRPAEPSPSSDGEPPA